MRGYDTDIETGIRGIQEKMIAALHLDRKTEKGKIRRKPERESGFIYISNAVVRSLGYQCCLSGIVVGLY